MRLRNGLGFSLEDMHHANLEGALVKQAHFISGFRNSSNNDWRSHTLLARGDIHPV
jgi:hypothetical protein